MRVSDQCPYEIAGRILSPKVNSSHMILLPSLLMTLDNYREFPGNSGKWSYFLRQRDLGHDDERIIGSDWSVGFLKSIDHDKIITLPYIVHTSPINGVLNQTVLTSLFGRKSPHGFTASQFKSAMFYITIMIYTMDWSAKRSWQSPQIHNGTDVSDWERTSYLQSVLTVPQISWAKPPGHLWCYSPTYLSWLKLLSNYNRRSSTSIDIDKPQVYTLLVCWFAILDEGLVMEAASQLVHFPGMAQLDCVLKGWLNDSSSDTFAHLQGNDTDRWKIIQQPRYSKSPVP